MTRPQSDAQTHARWLRRQAEWHVAHSSGRIGDVDYAAETLRLLDALEDIADKYHEGTTAGWLAMRALTGQDD